MNIEHWVDFYDKEDRGKFEIDTDALLSNNIVLLPGRFYILYYKSETKDVYNSRPIILSLGLSKKDNESFLCIDLCMIPRKIRIKFIQMYYDMFKKQIDKQMSNYIYVRDADKQEQITEFTYGNLFKIKMFEPIKNAVKRYKIKNTYKIYSILYCDIYKVLGKYSDINCFKNGNIVDIQNDFLKKCIK